MSFERRSPGQRANLEAFELNAMLLAGQQAITSPLPAVPTRPGTAWPTLRMSTSVRPRWSVVKVSWPVSPEVPVLTSDADAEGVWLNGPAFGNGEGPWAPLYGALPEGGGSVVPVIVSGVVPARVNVVNTRWRRAQLGVSLESTPGVLEQSWFGPAKIVSRIIDTGEQWCLVELNAAWESITCRIDGADQVNPYSCIESTPTATAEDPGEVVVYNTAEAAIGTDLHGSQVRIVEDAPENGSITVDPLLDQTIVVAHPIYVGGAGGNIYDGHQFATFIANPLTVECG